MNFPIETKNACLVLAPFAGVGVDVFQMTKSEGPCAIAEHAETYLLRFNLLTSGCSEWLIVANSSPVAFGEPTAVKTIILAAGSPNAKTLSPWYLCSYPPYETRNLHAPIPRGWKPGIAVEGEIVLVRNPWVPGGWEKKKGPQTPCLCLVKSKP